MVMKRVEKVRRKLFFGEGQTQVSNLEKLREKEVGHVWGET